MDPGSIMYKQKSGHPKFRGSKKLPRTLEPLECLDFPNINGQFLSVQVIIYNYGSNIVKITSWCTDWMWLGILANMYGLTHYHEIQSAFTTKIPDWLLNFQFI
jgi:hypothetical protein